jgi:NAD-reducing hydrogenase large subunit
MRRLMHYGQMFQSHVLHFFHLASPDLLFGVDGDPALRNVIGVAIKHKELAVQAVMMRKFGQEIIKATAGKKVHGTGAVPGGINKHLTQEEKDHFLNGPDPMNIDKMIDWSLGALEFFKGYHAQNKDLIDNFAAFPSSHVSLVRKDGAMDLYHGVLRGIDSEGNKVLNDVDYQDYLQYIDEEVKSWSYMKFPYLRSIGKKDGWYRVGPLARMNTCDYIPTPLAQKEFEIFKAYTNGKPNGMSMHMHWARLIEILHSAEMMKELLNDPDLMTGELTVKGTKQKEGVGLLEAPRGTLFHHYRINDDDQIEMANLIVSTTNNNTPMNTAVNLAAKQFMNGQAEISEGMMNAVEVAIRAYDPCLSCATHALGKMPLEAIILDANGMEIDRKLKNG